MFPPARTLRTAHSIDRPMTKPFVLLTIATLGVVAAMVWLATPADPSAQNFTLPETTSVSVPARADEGARTPDEWGTGPSADALPISSLPVEKISTQAPLAAPSPPHRRTTAARPPSSTVSPSRALSGTHIRVVSGGAVSDAPSPVAPSAPLPGTITLEVDASLHDPAVWVEDEDRAPRTPAQESIEERIAGQFDAAVAAAVTDPATAKRKALDAAWREARARAHEEYQLFFGAEAANRAALKAGRAALAPP